MSESSRKVLATHAAFESASRVLVLPEDYRDDAQKQTAILVFFFGALDAYCQMQSLDERQMYDVLLAYLKKSATHREAKVAADFLYKTSGDPAWIPTIRESGQAATDFIKGDSKAAMRLFRLLSSISNA